MIKRNHCVLDEIIYLDKLMKHGFGLILRFSFILIVFVLFAPSSTLIAQDDSGEEVFWGDDGSEDVVRVLRNSVMVGRLLVNLVRNNLRDVNIVIIILERLKRFELLLSLVFCCSC